MKQEVTSEITSEVVSKNIGDDPTFESVNKPETIEAPQTINKLSANEDEVESKLEEPTVNIKSSNLEQDDESHRLLSHKPVDQVHKVMKDNYKYMSTTQRPLKMRLRNNKRISHFNQFKIKQPQ